MDWRVLQLADSAFPTGGFAHSAGLEAAMQQGEVATGGVGAWARRLIRQTGRGALPFVGTAHDAPRDLARLDKLCDAFLSNPVANRASRAQGRSFVAACAAAFEAKRLEKWGDAEGRPLHHAPAFGAAAAEIGVGRGEALRAYLFSTLRSGLSAAVRLGLSGPLEAQRIQADCALILDETLARCSTLAVEEAAQTEPLLDLFQSTQDRLYSRLFQS